MAAQDSENLYSLPYDRMPTYNDYESLINLPKLNGHTIEGNKTAADYDIIVPIKVSDLPNDVHYATESQIPTQLSQLANNVGFTTQAYVDDKIANVRGDIPTKTSDLTNDSGFITSSALPTKTSDLTNDSDFTTKTYVDTELAKYAVLDGATIVTTLLGTEQFTSTFDNLATNIQTKLTALKAALTTGESIEIKGIRINTIGNLKPTNMIVINSSTDLLTLVIDWQGFTYNNNVVQAIDIVNKKVLTLTMTNDTNDDSYVSYFNDNVDYTFTIEYTKYKTLDLT